MINQERWTDSLPKINRTFDNDKNQLNEDRWLKTISQKKQFNSVKSYSLVSAIFVCGLLTVSVIKNETRKLEKEITSLELSIDTAKFDLDQEILDHEVITSPENITRLAKEYLNSDLLFYKRSQILSLNNEKFSKTASIKKKENNSVKSLKTTVKNKISKKIKEEKTKVAKIKKLYNNPKSIPNEVKIQAIKKVDKAKNEIEKIYNSPKEAFTLERVGKWGVVQVVKVFLGIPVVPGR
jgi:hypothetical protein